MAANLHKISTVISSHAWNADRSRVAVCPNTNEIRIYKVEGSEYTLEHILPDHDQLVTGIDWGHKTNRILSCSQDRNAFVWTYNDEEKTWEPTLVILRINRAATKCMWSPKEDKFAVASSAKVVSVCYFEEDNDWWVSKHIKKHGSTITDLSWHPNNVLLATSGSDFRCRVFSGFVKGIDNRKDFAGGTPFGKKLPFGALLKECEPVGGWVHSVRWSPSGNKLAYVAHDSTVHILDCADENHVEHCVNTQTLPYRDLIWLTENSLICVGHDYNPTLFSSSGEGWKLVAKLDAGSKKKAQGFSAMAKFKALDRTGDEKGSDLLKIVTRHQNSIQGIFKIDDNRFSTIGADGNVAVWDLGKLKSEVEGLQIA